MPRAARRSAKPRSAPAGPGKVDQGVTAFLRLSKRVPILVLFREQADSLHAYEAAVQAASVATTGSPTPRQAQSAGRTGVMQALQTVAAQSQSAIAPLLKQLRAAKHCAGVRPFFVINAMALEATREGVDALAAHPAVARILPDRWVTLEPLLEGEPVPEQGVGWNLTKIGAPLVWALGIDGSGVTVGAIDTGVEYGHPALERKFRGYNAADPSHPSLEGNWYDAVHGRQNLPYDDHRHGTHVTGTMVGGEPGGAHPIGVAPGARWIAAKGFNERGQGSSSWLLAAGEWMLAPRDGAGVPHPEWAPDVINNSWGGGPGVDEWYRPLITNWRNAGILPLVAAGNGDPDPGSLSSPGNYPEAIAVGALDSLGRLSSFSGRAPSPYGEIKPEVTAPGSSIRSAVPGGGYSSLSGTAMAAPHISGVAALLLSAAPGMTPDQVESILKSTAMRLTNRDYPESPNNGFGYGLVSALEALSAIRGTGTIAGRVLGPEQTAEGATDALPPDTTLLVDFALGTAPGPGGVEGIVRNGASGAPLAGVLVGVAEVPAIPPVQTDGGGLFRLALEPGSYTLRLEQPFFYSLEHPVRIVAPGESLSVELSLRPFIAGEEALLAYDDGTFENSDAWTGEGSGWAVRMTPPAEGGMLVRASFLLMDSRWPVPGGDRFRMAIYDSDGAAGGPGRLLAEERPAAGLRSGEWTEVELSALGLVLQREFYVAYLQEGTYPAVPGLTTDTTEPFQERSWERDGGDWFPSAAAGGNRMIRAVLRRPAEPSLELLVTEPP